MTGGVTCKEMLAFKLGVWNGQWDQSMNDRKLPEEQKGASASFTPTVPLSTTGRVRDLFDKVMVLLRQSG